MNKRLIWNFEINTDTVFYLSDLERGDEQHLRWETRFFWPDEQIITLHGLDESFLQLSKYQVKHREDTYFLLPGQDYNLKIRRAQLFYKPILTKHEKATAYGKKINLSENQEAISLATYPEKKGAALIAFIKQQGKAIDVTKDALVYTSTIQPSLKLELARLQVGMKTYFSVSVESRSQVLVESLTERLLRQETPSDYVSFLQGLDARGEISC